MESNSPLTDSTSNTYANYMVIPNLHIHHEEFLEGNSLHNLGILRKLERKLAAELKEQRHFCVKYRSKAKHDKADVCQTQVVKLKERLKQVRHDIEVLEAGLE